MANGLLRKVGPHPTDPRLSIGRIEVQTLDRQGIMDLLRKIPTGHYAVVFLKKNDDLQGRLLIVVAKLELGDFKKEGGTMVTNLKLNDPLDRTKATQALDLYSARVHRRLELDVPVCVTRDCLRSTTGEGYSLLEDVPSDIKVSYKPSHYSVLSIVNCSPDCIPIDKT